MTHRIEDKLHSKYNLWVDMRIYLSEKSDIHLGRKAKVNIVF